MDDNFLSSIMSNLSVRLPGRITACRAKAPDHNKPPSTPATVEAQGRAGLEYRIHGAEIDPGIHNNYRVCLIWNVIT